MATRKKATRGKKSTKNTRGKSRAALKKLLKEAQAEVKILLREPEVRSTKALRTGLKEIKRYLDEMGPLEFNA